MGRQLVILPSAATELDDHRTIRAFLRRDVVEAVGFLFVGLEIAFGVVDADRPETVDGHVLDVEQLGRRAVFLAGVTVEKRRPCRDRCPSPSPFRSGAARDRRDPCCHRHPSESVNVLPSAKSASRTLFRLVRSHLGTSKRPRPGCFTLMASCRAWTCCTSLARASRP